ncbi:MAG: NADP-dependent malic enzyme, partial [Alphaproteobacteria bacterium]|nr:NADP-dependent malic enzyme [Alphaproteobacteria bacterium]
LEDEALALHSSGRPGKLEISPTKPLTTQRDLSLAYSPGVAIPCLKIAENNDCAYDYTAKGNLVAVISNGTAVLGLGDLGALASKPVMEGKAVLFKRFADIDGIDLEVDTRDVDEFINSVKHLGPSFGGINLEDIKAPECFIIEDKLKEIMDIPVFHDDQHGTAIIALAALINGLDLTNRSIEKTKFVLNGAGAASLACVELIKNYGALSKNITIVDRTGVIYKGRKEGMNPWKETHTIETKDRTLLDAIDGADVFIGLSAKGALSKDMVKKMAKNPIIFAMANPDPEITPEEVQSVRTDAIVATGRSDYPNQVNNVLGFPYIFRGALDAHAKTINEEMKIAAAEALARLAREDVPDEVAAAYSGRRLQYGPEYIIPVPFDPRLIATISSAVAEAAMKTGVARRKIKDLSKYQAQLNSRLDPMAATLQLIFESVKANPKRIAFAEGEEDQMIRAAIAYSSGGYGEAILIGRDDVIQHKLSNLGLKLPKGVTIHNAALSEANEKYIEFLYKKLQRKGYLQRDVQRMVHQDRHIFGSCMVEFGHADGLITGLTRSYPVIFDEIQSVFEPKSDREIFGLSLFVNQHRALFISDTTIHEIPTSEQLANIAIQSAQKVRELGHEPKVALLSHANYGNPARNYSERVRKAVEILDQRKVDFEYDGEMTADVALNPQVRSLYPFCRLKGEANVLIMPTLDAAHISSKLLRNIGQGTLIGPLLVGLNKPVQILQRGSTVSELVNLAVLLAHEAQSE